jgi:phosphoglycolate phosphatase
MLYLFDLDGTLIDSEAGITGSMRYAFAQMDRTPPSAEILRTWIGPPLRVTFPTVLGDDPALTETAIGHYRTRFDREGWAEHTVYDQMPELINALHAAGHQLAIVTTKLQTQAQKIIAHLPFGSAFARVYGPSADGLHAGKAELIARALIDFTAGAAATTMIGDRYFDIEGALANDVRGIGVLWGFGNREELEHAGATAIASTPQQLAALLL